MHDRSCINGCGHHIDEHRLSGNGDDVYWVCDKCPCSQLTEEVELEVVPHA